MCVGAGIGLYFLTCITNNKGIYLYLGIKNIYDDIMCLILLSEYNEVKFLTSE